MAVSPKKRSPRKSTEPKLAASEPGMRFGLDVRPGPEAIRLRAFELYLQDGQVDGRDLEHWLRAERELAGGDSSGMAG